MLVLEGVMGAGSDGASDADFELVVGLDVAHHGDVAGVEVAGHASGGPD